MSTKTTPEIVDFDAAGLLGGIIHNGRGPMGTVLDQDVFGKIPTDGEDVPFRRRTVRMQCFPLYSVLMALGNPAVDLLSLDIEGAELQVLKTIPWKKVRARVLLIETINLGEVFVGSLKNLNQLLKKNGFKFYKSIGVDDIYIQRYFNVIDDAKTEL